MVNKMPKTTFTVPYIIHENSLSDAIQSMNPQDWLDAGRVNMLHHLSYDYVRKYGNIATMNALLDGIPESGKNFIYAAGYLYNSDQSNDYDEWKDKDTLRQAGISAKDDFLVARQTHSCIRKMMACEAGSLKNGVGPLAQVALALKSGRIPELTPSTQSIIQSLQQVQDHMKIPDNAPGSVFSAMQPENVLRMKNQFGLSDMPPESVIRGLMKTMLKSSDPYPEVRDAKKLKPNTVAPPPVAAATAPTGDASALGSDLMSNLGSGIGNLGKGAARGLRLLPKGYAAMAATNKRRRFDRVQSRYLSSYNGLQKAMVSGSDREVEKAAERHNKNGVSMLRTVNVSTNVSADDLKLQEEGIGMFSDIHKKTLNKALSGRNDEALSTLTDKFSLALDKLMGFLQNIISMVTGHGNASAESGQPAAMQI